jgi:hypothetical protein
VKRLLHSVRRVARIPRRIHGEISALVLAGYFWLLNIYGRAPITRPGGPVVSLTTYGARIRTVCLAIESIGRGLVLPSRIILWIDNKLVFNNLPASIRRLAQRGLEVRLCKDYGPHKKYYPYLESLQRIEVPLVTADDDILYPRYWLKRLVNAFHQFPDVVNCYRARVMIVNQDGFGAYKSWELAKSTKSRFCHCPGNGAGAIYPLALQRAVKQEGTAFLNCCPKADDLWLHAQALRAGYRVRQISNHLFPLLSIPGTQGIALFHHNQDRGGNDSQIALTYRTSDIDRLREDEFNDVRRPHVPMKRYPERAGCPTSNPGGPQTSCLAYQRGLAKSGHGSPRGGSDRF